MNLRAYTLHDVKALQYNPPFFAPTDAAATRMVKDLVMDMNTMPGRHPSDFKLYVCGTYDDLTGRFEPVYPLVHVIDANALVPVSPPVDPGLFDRMDRDHPMVKAETQRLAKEILKANGLDQ